MIRYGFRRLKIVDVMVVERKLLRSSNTFNNYEYFNLEKSSFGVLEQIRIIFCGKTIQGLFLSTFRLKLKVILSFIW